MPTVSMNATALPPRALASSAAAGQRGLAQRDVDQPSAFESLLSVQTDNPPGATGDQAPPAATSQGDIPSRQVGSLASANDEHNAGPQTPSGWGSNISGATPLASELGLPTTKVARKAATSAPDASALLAATAPAPPTQASTQTAPSTPTANPEATDISAGSAAALLAAAGTADDAAAPPGPDDKDTDTSEKGGKDEQVGDGQIATPPDSSAQASQPGSDSVAPPAAAITPQPVAAVAATIPTPVAPTGGQNNRNGSDTDSLTVSADRSLRIDLPSPGVASPKLAPTTSGDSPDPAGAPTAADASHQAPTPISNGDPSHKPYAALPTDPAAPATAPAATTAATPGSAATSPPAAPAQPAEQASAPADAGAIGSGGLAKTSVESDDRTRDLIRLPDPSGNGGLAAQSQPLVSPAGAGGATHATAASASSSTTAAPVPVAEVGVTIAMQAQSGKSRFEIRLDQPELGRIDVELNVDSRGTVTSRLIVERPETLNLLVRDAPQLQRTLQDAGLNTTGGMQFSLADQGSANRNGFAQQNAFASPPANRDLGDAMPVAPLQSYAAWSRRSGGLDITV